MDAFSTGRRRRFAVVLLVDEDRRAREVLAAALAGAGMYAAHASTRADALRVARTVQPDVVVVERALPDGDGWSIVDELRRWVVMHDLVAIATTRCAKLWSVERACRAGCEGFVERPCDPHVVVDEARRLVAAREKNASVSQRLRDSRAHRQARAQK